MTTLNDIHSRLNETSVAGVVTPQSTDELACSIAESRGSIAFAGGRHAMGGQQFLTDGLVIDMRAMNRVLELDTAARTVRVQAGITWTELIDELERLQQDEPQILTIRQKQTGADDITVGGSVSANAHGRGLHLAPIVDDVVSLTLVDHQGQAHNCSRSTNRELFSHAVGGYGLFGAITEVVLVLEPRTVLRRHVELSDVQSMLTRYNAGDTSFAQYGDLQCNPYDGGDDVFLNSGILSAYVPDDTQAAGDEGAAHEAVIDQGAALSKADWINLLTLAHTNREQAFELYTQHYLKTHGQRYYSDRHQLSTYLPDFAATLDERLPGPPSRLMITELYVPPAELPELMASARGIFRETGVEPIYNTIRLIHEDQETVLRWATQELMCVIFNVRMRCTPAGLEQGRVTLCRLIDAAIALRGSYYLTYHRYASPQQLELCYPAIRSFMRFKAQWDPDGRFQSDWYTHYKEHFA